MTVDGEGGDPARSPKGPSRGKRRIWGIMGVGGGLALVALVFFGLRLSGALKAPAPAPGCVEPKLALGSSVYRIKPVKVAAGGSVVVPQDVPDAAYWVEGTNTHYVFGLSAAPDNLGLESSLSAGDPVTITWADCMTDTYAIESVGRRVVVPATLADQSTGGVTVFVEDGGASAGLVVQAVRPVARVEETAAPAPEGEVQADMAFGETTVSADGNAVTMSVTITNTGSAPLAITLADIWLTPENGQEEAPLSVQPALPQDIAPQAGLTLQVTFPHPHTTIATLRILTFTMDQYF